MTSLFSLYPRYEYTIAATQLVFAMIGMGLTLRPADFSALAKSPRWLIFGLILQIFGAPLLAFAYINLRSFPEGIALGYIMIAAMPGGSATNLFTYLGRGNTPLSIALTGIASFTCLITIPPILKYLGGTALPENFTLPTTHIIFEIVIFTILPLVSGMFVSTRRTNPEALAKWFVRGSLVCLGMVVVGSLGSGRIDLSAYGFADMRKVISFALLLASISWLAMALQRAPARDQMAVSIEMTLRNINLAILLSTSLFATLPKSVSGDALFCVLFYGGNALWISGAIALIHRRLAIKRVL